MRKNVLVLEKIPGNFLKRLDSRSISLWLPQLNTSSLQDDFIDFLSLPWTNIISESSDPYTLNLFESLKNREDQLTRKRGLVYIFDCDPNSVELPHNNFSIYLLNGLGSGSIFENQSRKFAMLNALRKSGLEELVVLFPEQAVLSDELEIFLSSGLDIDFTFIVEGAGQTGIIEALAEKHNQKVTIVPLGVAAFIHLATEQFFTVYTEDRKIIRVKDFAGSLGHIDITDASSGIAGDIFEYYSIITAQDLVRLSPEDLPEDEFNSFFSSDSMSWKPFAAQLPWQRDTRWLHTIEKKLKLIEAEGADENSLCYFTAESGSGCTTTLRSIGWNLAAQGYPVLVAQKFPFLPDALQLTTYLFQVLSIISAQEKNTKRPLKYETPWVLIFDTDHWESREGELLSFFREIKNSGRAICIVAAFNRNPSLQSISSKKIGHISHSISNEQAGEIGRCVNKFLQIYNKARSDRDWDTFYQDHAVDNRDGGVVSFWIALSFWIRFYHDLGDSIQSRLFKSFMRETSDTETRLALLEIAAMSAERLTLPEDILPPMLDGVPTSHALREKRLDIPMLTLNCIRRGSNYWALAHDTLGILLLNAAASNNNLLQEMNLGQVQDAIHLRLKLLARIACRDALGKKWNRSVAEDFATTIFKIDPENGQSTYAHYWQEVITALDSIPTVIRQTSRLFLHHTAITRRRICSSLGSKERAALFGITDEIKRNMLTRAIDDLNFALEIAYTPGDETNLNIYNTLSISYRDLADVEEQLGADKKTVLGLRSKASEEGRRAFETNPTNSFALETYVKNLLVSARESPSYILPNCMAALDILYSAIGSQRIEYRQSRLGNLVEDTLKLLFSDGVNLPSEFKAETPYEPLLRAWRILFPEGEDCAENIRTMNFTHANCEQALKILQDSSCEHNLYLINLKYKLNQIVTPYSFQEQLILVEQIVESKTLDPQIKLEYAILLYMCGRFRHGEQEFYRLRELWRGNDYFVTVPENLKWLRGLDIRTPIRASAKVGPSGMYTPRVIVDNLQGQAIPFRPEAFGLREARAGQVLTGYISFNYKGPFFRPSFSE